MGTKKEKLYCLWCAVPGGRANDVPDEEVSLDTGCHQVCVPMSMFMRVCYVLCYVFMFMCVFVHMTVRTATSGRWGRANGTRVTRHVQGSGTGM